MKTLIAAGLALSLLGAASTAEAASFRGDRNDGFRNNGRHESVDRNFGNRDFGNRDYGRNFNSHRWARGERLSHRWGAYSTVNDWHRYNLRRPPRGYHWVRYGNDYILAAIATGLIADLMLGGAYGY